MREESLCRVGIDVINDVFLVIDCGFLFVLKNGFFIGNLIVFFNSVVFNCDFGFFFNGFVMRKC